MGCRYIIINDSQDEFNRIHSLCNEFLELDFMAYADCYSSGIDAVLEHQPQLIFLEIDPRDKRSNLSLSFISELYRYFTVVPKIIVTAKNSNLAYESIKYGILDYLIAPIQITDLRKTLLRIDNSVHYFPASQEMPSIGNRMIGEGNLADKKKGLTICIKSYGDYRFIDAADVMYLQADNNSTDIHLNNGEMITAFKTLKHFEKVLPEEFYRIHNSYIINKDFISRIHSGNSVCFIKNTSTKIPFSKSYKRNINKIILSISTSSYLEI